MSPVAPAVYELKSMPLDTGAAAEAARRRASLGERRFGEARSAFDAGRYAEASGGFLEAAEHFRPGPDGFAAEVLRDNRAACYRDAALAFRAAGGQAGRARLDEAAGQDPDHAALLRSLAGQLR